MARTKKQVLQATARKQQLHLEAVEKASTEGASATTAPAVKKGKTDNSLPLQVSQAPVELGIQFDPYERPPGRPHKTASPRKLKSLLDQFNDKESETGKSNHEGSLYKKIILAPKKVKADNQQSDKQSKKKEPLIPSFVNTDLTEDDTFKTTPISGPVNLKKTKLTARKSTNVFKKAEARELLESLTRRETETAAEQRDSDNNDHEAILHTYCPVTNEFYSPIGTPVCISEGNIDFDKDRHSMAFPKGRVCARKSLSSEGWQPTARKSLKLSPKLTKGCGRKSVIKTFKAKKTFPPCPLSPEDLELIKNYEPISSSPDLESLTVFPSVHEAVITLPKSEKLPVALVCIKDIYKAIETTEDVSCEKVTNKETSTPVGKKSPSPRGRKLNRQHSPRRSTEKARSPRRSPKGERRSKNIFEQFQTEIKEEDGPRTRKLANSPGRKNTSQNVASTTFASAMKVLRSVSEKVDGRRKKSGIMFELSPRKRSPRRNSLHLEIPEPSASFASSPTKTSTSPKSPRSGRRLTEDAVRRSGSASPRGDRRIRSPSIKLQDDNVVYMSLVKRDRLSPKANSSELMLSLKRESPRESERAKNGTNSSAVRELDFVAGCSEQIVKNLNEEKSNVDNSLSVKSSSACKTDLPPKSSSAMPSTSAAVRSNHIGPISNVTNKKGQELLDLISKVDSQIKNPVLPPLDASQCPEDDESETSSLNTSHNSETFAQLIDQMETEASLSQMKSNVSETQIQETDVDSVPSDVKCGELYRRLVGKVTDKPYIQPKSQDIKISEPSQSASASGHKEEGLAIAGKPDSCLLKKHLLSEIIPVSKILESRLLKENTKDTKEPVSVGRSSNSAPCGESAIKSTTSKSEEPSEGKRVPLWRKLYKTKEPLPLDILSKAEKVSNVDKKSAFVSDELENYLESSKNLSLTSQGTPEHIKEKPSPDLKEIASELKDLEPDFDEVEGVLFLSFASKDAMDAHIAVEKKNKWDKDANHLLGVSRLLAFEKEKDANIDGDLPDEQAKCKIQRFQNLRGQHMKWKKYKRMLREEFKNMKQAREKGEFYHCFRQPEKTSDITKIKGWKNKFVDKTDIDAGKLHWRTEERLMRNLEPDDLRALGIKKKRRKNVVFTRRKGTFKDVGYPVGRTSTYGQSGSPPDDPDNWQVMMGEYEEPLYENNEDRDADHSDDEMRNMDWSHSYEEDSLDISEEMDYHVRDKPYCYAKRIKLRREYAEVFNWTDDELKIVKKLGGVRNRRKKSDIELQMAVNKAPEMKKKLRVIKVKRSSYIPVSVITTRMAIDAACALDFGEYKPTRPGTGYTDNIITKPMMPKKIQPSTLAGLKLLKKGKALLRAQKEKKGSMLKSGVPIGYITKRRNLSGEESADTSLEEDDAHDGESKRSCDKPGCRYGCICHLCNDNQEELEPRPQESAVHTCNKEYCRLGCICDSLGAGQDTAATEQHCGKPECMIQCVCSKPNRRHSIGASSAGHPDEGGISSDEIPSLIQDSDVSAERPKLENEKPKEEDKSAAPKTWSRHAKGDKYSNLPRRESRHRVSKNLDAITRKAMMVYETSEVYCEQSGRRKKHGDEVATAPRTSISKITSPPSKHTKGPPAAKVAKRKHSSSQEVVHISDDEDVAEISSCARMSSYSSTKMNEKDLSGDATVVHIEKASDGSGTSSVCITPGNSRPSSPVLNNQDLRRKLAAVTQKHSGTSEHQAANASEPPKRKLQRILPQDFVQSAWHTQMVCLKANPKPKDPKDPKVKTSDAEGEEIKLLEFMANCNWDNAKPHILSRVAQCLSRGVYPDPRRMVIGDFIVEILPKADKSAVIPPELRDKLPNSMYSIRVKVMRKASERDFQKFQMKAAIVAAQLKQHRASLNKPRDSVSSQSCDSASKRVFQNTSFNALDKSRTISQNMTRASTASVSTPSVSTPSTTSSPMGISGLSRLQISHPTATFSDNANLPGTRNITDMTNLSNISSVKHMPGANASEMEQITVQNTETGASISMLVENPDTSDQEEAKNPEDKAEKKNTKTFDTSVDNSAADIVTEAHPKILRATTSSNLDKLGKIPLSGPWDGDIASILMSSTDDSGAGNGEKQEDETIDLTEDNSEQRSENKNSQSEVIFVGPQAKSRGSSKMKQVPSRRPVPSSVPIVPTNKRSLLNPSPMPVPASQAPVPSVVPIKPVTPIPPTCSKILVPVGTSVPPTGSKFILAGTPVTTKVPSVGPGARPTKTIISTPGGKLYGPFNDINDVKMLQVKAPDGTVQPLIKLLPANSLPLVQAAKQHPQTVSSGATKTPVPDPNPKGYPISKMKSSDSSRNTSGPHGTIVNGDGSLVETKKQKKQRKNKPSKIDDNSPLKKVRKRRQKSKPSSDVCESAEKLDAPKVKETFDEVDGESVSAQHEPTAPKCSTATSSKSKVMLIADTKMPVMRRKSVEFQLPSGETFLVTENYNCDDPSGATNSAQMTSSKGQSALNDKNTADKENFDGDYSETISAGHKNTSSDSSQVKKLSHPPAASVAVGDGLRQSRSSSLDSPASEPIQTSTPIPITHKLKVQQGFLPVKRQRSGSDSAAFADASKRIKLVIDSPEASISGLRFGSGDCPTKLTPIQKFRERMNIPVIDVSDDDSQMSNSSGNSLQGLCSFNQSEETHNEEMGSKGDEQREKKSTRERARRQDILCMFMYLYNTLSNGEETPNEPLSRQKVLDSALQTIEYERKVNKQLEDELKMENFYHRAHERRLKSVVDKLIKRGVSATVILSHLNHVKHKEEKRLSKKRILQKIIKYGQMQTTGENTEIPVPGVSSAKPTSKKKSDSNSSRSSTPTAGSDSQTMLEKIKSNPKMRVDPENPSQYWSENFLIEIEKEIEEEDDQGETTDAGDVVTVTVETSSNNEAMDESKPVHTSSNMEEREVIQDIETREVIQNKKGVELNKDLSQAGTDELSGNSTSMQNSPVRGESDDILRDKDSEKNEPKHGTLQRSNSEEAILQVESFIENAEKWSRDPEGQDLMATSCDTESKSVSDKSLSDCVYKKDDSAESATKTKVRNSCGSSRPVENTESCSENSEREKSEDRESLFESLLPSEVNFDDASVESVPLESKTPNSVSSNENLSEQTMNVIIDSPREITQTGLTIEDEEEDSSAFQKSTEEEKFMICDVRSMAKDEFFCTS